MLNSGASSVPVDDLGQPALTSEATAVTDGMLAPDTAAWFRV